MAKEFEDVRFKMFEKKTGELSEADRQKLVRARKSKIKGQSQKVLKDMVNRKFKEAGDEAASAMGGYSKGGRAKLRGGGMSQRGLGKAFKKGGKA